MTQIARTDEQGNLLGFLQENLNRFYLTFRDSSLSEIRLKLRSLSMFTATIHSLLENSMLKGERQEFKQQLALMLVHDLRNPSASIKLIAETLIRRGQVNGDVKEGLQDILEVTQCLDRRVDNLLTIGRASRGHFPLSVASIDGRELIQNTVGCLKVIAASRSCQLIVELPSQAVTMSIDADLIGRVLENLIVNAIKFSPQGSQVKIRLSQSPQSDLGHRDSIQVIDEGYGLPEKNRKAIFEPFNIGQSIEGILQTGLGLAFCKLAVEAHGGVISAENNLPKGTIFSVVL